jgi:hypothetical protein
MPMTYYAGAYEPEDMPPAPQGPDENRQAAAAFSQGYAIVVSNRTGHCVWRRRRSKATREEGINDFR